MIIKNKEGHKIIISDSIDTPRNVVIRKAKEALNAYTKSKLNDTKICDDVLNIIVNKAQKRLAETVLSDLKELRDSIENAMLDEKEIIRLRSIITSGEIAEIKQDFNDFEQQIKECNLGEKVNKMVEEVVIKLQEYLNEINNTHNTVASFKKAADSKIKDEPDFSWSNKFDYDGGKDKNFAFTKRTQSGLEKGISKFIAQAQKRFVSGIGEKDRAKYLNDRIEELSREFDLERIVDYTKNKSKGQLQKALEDYKLIYEVMKKEPGFEEKAEMFKEDLDQLAEDWGLAEKRQEEPTHTEEVVEEKEDNVVEPVNAEANATARTGANKETVKEDPAVETNTNTEENTDEETKDKNKNNILDQETRKAVDACRNFVKAYIKINDGGNDIDELIEAVKKLATVDLRKASIYKGDYGDARSEKEGIPFINACIVMNRILRNDPNIFSNEISEDKIEKLVVELENIDPKINEALGSSTIKEDEIDADTKLINDGFKGF